MDEPGEQPAERRRGRPAAFWRMLAGAFHVPAGMLFLLRTPRLWPLALLPIALTALLLIGGLLAGAFAVPLFDDVMAPRGEQSPVGGLLFAAALWLALPLTGLMLGLALALLLASPILERLSVAVERQLRGQPAAIPKDLGWEVKQSLRGALYFALRAPAVFLVSLIPLLGPLLAALWAAHAISFQLTEAPLQRMGKDFWERRHWHRAHRAESMGFGLAGFLTLFVPFANFLLAPALVVGATRLVLELEDVPEPEPSPLA
jgi:CysZ protein